MEKPRVLIYDIEVSSINIDAWATYDTNAIRVVDDWYMLSFAFKWLGEKKTYIHALPDYEGYETDRRNDYHLVKQLHSLFNEADVIIAHNGDKFDQRKSNARFIYHKLDPPSPYKQIDTLKVARRFFAFTSNKLNDLGQLLQCGKKVDTGGYDLWVGCYKGDPKAWAKMKKYNVQDVVLLEKVYKKLLPWMNNHPAMNLVVDKPTGCPKCGKGPMQKRGKRKFANTLTYQLYQCMSCKGWSRARTADKQLTKVDFVN